MPWYEKYNQIQTLLPGEQSVVFPGAPKGLVFPFDRGIARSLAPTQWKNFSPRLGLAYAPGQPLGEPGTASRRFFYGPGMANFNLALLKNLRLTESKVLQFRLEAFNAFNHAQFFGPTAVNGTLLSPAFGQVVNAAPPRLVQAALKLTF